jgi:hypothetical protein
MHRTVRAFGLVVDVQTDDARLFPLLDRQLPSFPEEPRSTTPRVSYRVAAAGGGRIVLLRGRRTLATTTDLWSVSDRLVADLQSALGRLASGWTFVHAGVVAIDGRALLLPARSSAGKTTLVAALLRAGASYGSDELAVLDPAGHVHPYARQLARRTPDRFLPAAQLGGSIMTGRTAVSAIVFTEFRLPEAPQLHRLSPGITILRLLEHCLGARGRPAETLQALAGATPAFVGARGEADLFARRLIDWARAGWRMA